jgi:pimeloyl-ACP methyl ester carboxylesterase
MSIALLLALVACSPKADTRTSEAADTSAATTTAATPYGANPSASGTFTHDGVTLYYETYGEGEPLLMIHGNGGSIGTMAAQIDHFRTKYKVIAMDSRDHGRSSDSPGALSYELMTDDLAALLEHLKVGPAYVFGWSDGGIEALMLGMRHPAKVKMIAAGAANLNPTAEALPEATLTLVEQMLASMSDSAKATATGRREFKVMSMMTKEPNIAPAQLATITAPTLVMAADQDLIRGEHTLTIFNHLPLGQLAIFPNATHMIIFDDPAMVNGTVERFFSTPFTRQKDRIADMMASLEKLLATLPK